MCYDLQLYRRYPDCTFPNLVAVDHGAWRVHEGTYSLIEVMKTIVTRRSYLTVVSARL